MEKTRPPTGPGDDFQVPLMNIFRSSVRDRDEAASDEGAGEGDREVSRRQIERREGTSYDRLKDFFLTDLGNLMSTVHLEAVQDLSEYPNVQRSVLNYGVQDVTNLTVGQHRGQDVRKRFRQALLDHEPRLIPETVVVKMREDKDENSQHLAFEVEAVMAARPVDVPLEFVAEIDVGAGKVLTSQLKVHE